MRNGLRANNRLVFPVDVLNCMGQSLPDVRLGVKEVNGKSFQATARPRKNRCDSGFKAIFAAVVSTYFRQSVEAINSFLSGFHQDVYQATIESRISHGIVGDPFFGSRLSAHSTLIQVRDVLPGRRLPKKSLAVAPLL